MAGRADIPGSFVRPSWLYLSDLRRKYWVLVIIATLLRYATSAGFLFIRPAFCLGLPSDLQTLTTHHSQAGCACAQRAMPGASTKKPAEAG